MRCDLIHGLKIDSGPLSMSVTSPGTASNDRDSKTWFTRTLTPLTGTSSQIEIRASRVSQIIGDRSFRKS